MQGGAGGEQALSPVGAGRGTQQGPQKALEGSHKVPAAQGSFAPCAGSILWSEGCSDTALGREWGFAGCAPKNPHPHLLPDEKKGFR